MLFFPLVLAAVMCAFGVAALRLNPRRPANQISAAVCFISALMFLSQLIARYHGINYAIDGISNPMPWVRLRFAFIGLLCPMTVWLCYYIISGRYGSRHELLKEMIPWTIISVFLISVSFSEAFKSSDSRPDNILNGPLYSAYFFIMFACQVALCVASIITARRLSGIRRLEFRFITIAFGYLGLAALFASLLDVLFEGRQPVVLAAAKTLSTLVFPVFGISAWSVTSRRIYHSSQVLIPLALRIGIIAALTLATAQGLRWLSVYEPHPAAAATVIALACGIAIRAHDRLGAAERRRSEVQTNTVARKLHTIAVAEMDPDRLLESCEVVLRDLAVGSHVRILKSQDNHFERGELVFAARELAGTPLLSEGFASVVALARAYPNRGAGSLRARLEDEGIHLLVSPRSGENLPSVIVAFGERESGLPFTHPEAEILSRLSEVVDGLYTKARFSLQARQAEQLATIGLVGAGLAHELRSPVETIDTFAHLLPARLDDREFLRDFAEVIPGEAKRIHALAEQLLHLSRPRTYAFHSVDIHDVIRDSLLLLREQARSAGVDLSLVPSATDHWIMADPQAIRQVCLNLVLNGIQSISARGAPGRIAIQTLNTDNEVQIQVEDDGPGIPIRIVGRLFRPFTSADKNGGLGLGLAICAEIAKVHRGRISAENRPNGGARFVVSLPTMAAAPPAEGTSVAKCDHLPQDCDDRSIGIPDSRAIIP